MRDRALLNREFQDGVRVNQTSSAFVHGPNIHIGSSVDKFSASVDGEFRATSYVQKSTAPSNLGNAEEINVEPPSPIHDAQPNPGGRDRKKMSKKKLRS
uniref:Uncharacterized protein n=1 Tax=Panagrolaimus sp. ES5 TaxID=591445 RepID=A0AC34F991_9BILA